MNFYQNRLQSLFLVHPKCMIPQLKHTIIKGLNNDEEWVGTANNIQVIGLYGNDVKSKYPFLHYYITIVYNLTKNRRCYSYHTHSYKKIFNNQYIPVYVSFHQHILMGKLKALRFKEYH